jgi:predicted ferric reductase
MAIVKKYHSQIVKIDNPLQDIYVVEIRSLDRPYRYKPGQFLHITLDEYDPSMPWPESRCFSMRSNDAEETIKITYAVKGKYTIRMAQELCSGKNVYLKLPYGDLFSRPHSYEKCVFIAGGTGIVPYCSLFTSAQFCDYINPRLYFGIRNRNYNIYESELHKARENNGDLEVQLSYEDEQGMLDIDAIFSANGDNSNYYLSGPPLMIKSFRKRLLEQNVPEVNIITDDWE